LYPAIQLESFPSLLQ